VLYCFIFLFFAAAGGGAWSLDAARGEASSLIPYPETIARTERHFRATVRRIATPATESEPHEARG